jgi:hypothetical protein
MKTLNEKNRPVIITALNLAGYDVIDYTLFPDALPDVRKIMLAFGNAPDFTSEKPPRDFVYKRGFLKIDAKGNHQWQPTFVCKEYCEKMNLFDYVKIIEHDRTRLTKWVFNLWRVREFNLSKQMLI